MIGEKYSCSTLCFGTATFVSGKLFPNKDSELGILSLQTALNNGINFIHSNPKLMTQWAIKEVLNNNPQYSVYHVIKVECPLDTDEYQMKAIFDRIISLSKNNLGIDNIHVIIYEIDVKKTKRIALLNDSYTIKRHFNRVREIFEFFRDKNDVDLLFCMCHNPTEMKTAIESKCFDGFAAYFNFLNTWPHRFFDKIYNASKDFIGVRPLAQGLLSDKNFYKIQTKNEKLSAILKSLRKEMNIFIQALSIKFTLSHPVVKSVIVGMNKPQHVEQLVEAAKHPLSLERYKKILKMTVTGKNADIRS